MAACASRRDTPIVAWHAVPGKACPGKEPSRRVRYDPGAPNPRGIFGCNVRRVLFKKAKYSLRAAARINGAFTEPQDARLPWKELYLRGKTAQHKFEAFYRRAITSNRCAHRYSSHRTLRDGSLGVVLSQALRARLRSYRPSGTFRNRH